MAADTVWWHMYPMYHCGICILCTICIHCGICILPIHLCSVPCSIGLGAGRVRTAWAGGEVPRTNRPLAIHIHTMPGAQPQPYFNPWLTQSFFCRLEQTFFLDSWREFPVTSKTWCGLTRIENNVPGKQNWRKYSEKCCEEKFCVSGYSMSGVTWSELTVTTWGELEPRVERRCQNCRTHQCIRPRPFVVNIQIPIGMIMVMIIRNRRLQHLSPIISCVLSVIQFWIWYLV